MSTTSHPPQSELQDFAAEYECSFCGGPRHAETSVRGSYCSAECFYRDKGRGVLEEIRRDHRICATCFRRIKTVMAPARDAPECAVGTQHRTEHTTWGLDDVSQDPYRSLDRQRWSCECGTVDPSERDDIIEDVEIEAIVPNLLRTLHWLDRSGAIQQRPRKDCLFEALREEWRDWEFAIGRCLYE